MKVLKQDIIDKVFQDATLFGQVAKSAKVAPVSLPRLLYNKHDKLTNKAVLETISAFLDIPENDLLEIQQDSGETATNVANNSTQKIPPKSGRGIKA